MAKTVTIYTTTYCPHCTRAKDLLTRKSIAFKEIDVTDNAALRDQLEAKTGWQTVPMIFIEDEFIGGADDLDALEQAGTLDGKVKG